jgi:hypothetical protein
MHYYAGYSKDGKDKLLRNVCKPLHAATSQKTMMDIFIALATSNLTVTS